jgi:DNA-binding transcriptional MocR family regulator
MLDALAHHVAGSAEWTDASGGLVTFVPLRAPVDTAERVPEAVRRGVAYVPGGPFFPHRVASGAVNFPPVLNSLRYSFRNFLKRGFLGQSSRRLDRDHRRRDVFR